jgi:hypothetical protein
MRLLKVIGILLIGPVLGVVSGFIVGGLLLPPDPTGRGAPGDGFLIMFSIGIGLAVSIPASVLLAVWSWRRPAHLKARPNPSEVPSS